MQNWANCTVLIRGLTPRHSCLLQSPRPCSILDLRKQSIKQCWSLRWRTVWHWGLCGFKLKDTRFKSKSQRENPLDYLTTFHSFPRRLFPFSPPPYPVPVCSSPFPLKLCSFSFSSSFSASFVLQSWWERKELWSSSSIARSFISFLLYSKHRFRLKSETARLYTVFTHCTFHAHLWMRIQVWEI